jgi:hypothetical protein
MSETQAVNDLAGIHHLKSHPSFFAQTLDGSKTFEVRRDDRGYRVDDKIVVHEWDPQIGNPRVADGYSGRTLQGTITCVVRGTDLAPLGIDLLGDDFVVLGVLWDHLR